MDFKSFLSKRTKLTESEYITAFDEEDKELYKEQVLSLIQASAQKYGYDAPETIDEIMECDEWNLAKRAGKIVACILYQNKIPKFMGMRPTEDASVAFMKLVKMGSRNGMTFTDCNCPLYLQKCKKEEPLHQEKKEPEKKEKRIRRVSKKDANVSPVQSTEPSEIPPEEQKELEQTPQEVVEPVNDVPVDTAPEVETNQELTTQEKNI